MALTSARLNLCITPRSKLLKHALCLLLLLLVRANVELDVLVGLESGGVVGKANGREVLKISEDRVPHVINDRF